MAVDLLIYLGYFALAFLGMLGHYLKRRVKGETFSDVRGYFVNHARESILSLIGLVIGFLAAYSTETLNMVSAPLIGYTADSIFNRWEEPENSP